MNIESRVMKLEDRIGIGQKAETLDEILEAFGAGRYGQATIMSSSCRGYECRGSGRVFPFIASTVSRSPG